MRRFADILNEELETQERSNRWLSEKTGINPTSIGDYRSGKTTPTIDRAMLIAKILKIDLYEFFSPEEVKSYKAREAAFEYMGIRKEGTIELPLFPAGAELLAASNQSKTGYSVDIAMARERFIAPESLRHDGAFAAKVDHLYDCDEEYDLIVIWPWEGQIKQNGVILFTATPPKELFIRRVILYDDGRFILKKPYLEDSIVQEDEIVLLGEVKFKGEWI